VSKQWKPNKKIVELEQPARPSRIRRDPVRADTQMPDKLQRWHSSEWEIGLALIGIVSFALALDVLVFGFSVITGH
jgi:hypothetical protein